MLYKLQFIDHSKPVELTRFSGSRTSVEWFMQPGLDRLGEETRNLAISMDFVVPWVRPRDEVAAAAALPGVVQQ